MTKKLVISGHDVQIVTSYAAGDDVITTEIIGSIKPIKLKKHISYQIVDFNEEVTKTFLTIKCVKLYFELMYAEQLKVVLPTYSNSKILVNSLIVFSKSA